MPSPDTNGKLVIKENLTIEDLTAFLPPAYFNDSSKVVFKDSLGHEKFFSILSRLWDHQDYNTDRISYTYDALNVSLIPEDSSDYFLRVTGNASYSLDLSEQVNFLSYLLVKKGNPFGDLLLMEFRKGTFYENSLFVDTTSPYTQADTTYRIAYHSDYSSPKHSDFPFADIVVTPEEGIIAFTDFDQVRWYFSRFE